jgi:hypothetical protein
MDKRIIEVIEACRPGSDDLLSAELRDVAHRLEHDPEAEIVYRRVQRWDAAVAAAMEQVTVPDGLAGRILDRLNAASPPTARQAPLGLLENAMASSLKAAQAEPVGEAVGRDLVPSVPVPGDKVELEKPERQGPRRWRRRQMLAAVSSLAAVLVLAAFVGILWQPRSSSPVEKIADEWTRHLGTAWQSIDRAPRDFPVPGAVVASPMAWQRVGNVASGRGVAYQLRNAQAGAAMLFVVKLSVAGSPPAPPASPQSTTGGKAIGYWQIGGLLYVLVVEGDERSYREFVNSVRRPLT